MYIDICRFLYIGGVFRDCIYRLVYTCNYIQAGIQDIIYSIVYTFYIPPCDVPVLHGSIFCK